MRTIKWLSCVLGFLPALVFGAECSVLKASGNAEYPPYSWRSSQDTNLLTGAMPLLAQRIAEEIGVEIQVLYVGAWARAQAELRTGNIDMLIGAFFTQPRTAYMDYLSPALTATQSVIWVNNQHQFPFAQLADLQDHQGATIINNSLGEEFDNYAKQHLRLFEVTKIEQAFRMLAEQRIDYVAYEKEPSVYRLQQLGLKNIVVLPKHISDEPLYLTLSKQSACNTPELRKKISRALLKAQQQGWAAELIQQVQSQELTEQPLL